MVFAYTPPHETDFMGTPGLSGTKNKASATFAAFEMGS